MSIPQYRQVYDCMASWFKMGLVNFSQQSYMLSFLKISSLYEVYVLLKICNYLKENSYEITDIQKIEYSVPLRALYENTKCNNLYVFKRDSKTVSVYYQPVVFDADKSENTGIGLYRNTTIPFPKLYGDDNPGGSYYSPDFLIKIEDSTENSIKYILADAKFSTLNNVKKYYVAPLAYKYLFSISPISPSDEILGLLIINGQSDDKEGDILTDVYDRSLTPGRISPRAEILTLTENKGFNEKIHIRLLTSAIGRYLAY